MGDDWDDDEASGGDSEVYVARAAVSFGRAASFHFVRAGERMSGFIFVGREGRARAFVNRCPHVPYPLDFGDGEVLDQDGLTIVCANHGARFDPDSGRCVWGPARGRGLEELPLSEEGERWRVSITPEPPGWPGG